MSTSPPHHTGHRSRLRERFLKSGIDALADYEIIEMILFASNPRGDVKPLAKDLIARFKTAEGVIKADVRELSQVSKLSQAAIANLKLAEAMGQLVVRSHISEGPIIQTWKNVLAYCSSTMGHLKIEQFRLLFLDRKNKLLCDEVQQSGTVDQTPVYPREVARRALEVGASSLIMVHNHPSGDPTPSDSDIRITKKVQNALDPLNIILHDHVIIGKNTHTSLRAEGYIV